MAYIIVKPTAVIEPILPQNPTQQQQDAYDAALLVYTEYLANLAVYTAQIASIRKLASPDLVTLFTDVELPESIITDDVYLRASEREVLREAVITVADLTSVTMELLETLVYIVQLRVAIELIPQLPQLLRQAEIDFQSQYADIDWTARVEKLEAIYLDEIHLINPTASTGVDSAIAVVVNTTASHEIDFEYPYHYFRNQYGIR